MRSQQISIIICEKIIKYHLSLLLCSCGEVVTKHERFNDLSIDLPRRKKKMTLCSIQDSLDLFFRASVLYFVF